MKKILLALFFAQSACVAVLAQTSLTLLKDIGKNESYNSNPQDMTRVGNLLYFTAENYISGRELWVSDGTFAGTRMVVDANPGTDGSSPASLTVVNNLLYFTAAGALWVSDGTPQGVQKLVEESGARIFGVIKNNILVFGTVPLTGGSVYYTNGTKAGTKRINTGTNSSDVSAGTVVFKDELYFRAYGANYTTALWKTDGTEAGSMRVCDLPGQGGLIAANSNYIFFIFDSHFTGQELWRTDGTQAGTALIKDISPGDYSTSFDSWTVINDKLVFSASPHNGDKELYVSDGTEAGTRLLKDIYAGTSSSFPYDFRFDKVSNQLFFTASTEAGREVWRTDGTTAGTRMIRDIYPGSEGSVYSLSETSCLFKGELYFSANDGIHGIELWKTDGTTAVLVKDGTPGAADTHFSRFDVVDNAIYCNGGYYIWRSDGTTAGTTMIYLSGFQSIGNPRYVNGKLFFTGTKSYYDAELYVTDGTDAGTKQLKNIKISHNLDPFPMDRFGELNGSVFFFSNSALWKSDGTQAGTVMMKDRALGLFEGMHQNIRRAGNTVVFSAAGPEGVELWKSDGTAAGTTLVKDIRAIGSSEPGIIESVNGITFFNAFTPETGRELWRTDGTTAGTFLLKDFYPGTESAQFVNGAPSVFKTATHLYFFIDTPEYGPALWRSDGTVSGTHLVKDMITSTGYIFVSFLTEVNGIVYFFCPDSAHGQELWRTDGTEAGTYLVKDIYPGPVGSQGAFVTHALTRGNTFYFSAADNVEGVELWKSDGTEAGTVRVTDLKPGTEQNYVSVGALLGTSLIIQTYTELWSLDESDGLTLLTNQFNGALFNRSANNKLFFTNTTSANGREVWVTDGTAAGTHLVKDIRQGAISSNPDNLFSDGNYLYFTANDGESIQLWRTDGTLCETKKLTKGPALIVSPFQKLNTNLVMWANTVDFGAELHSYSLTTSVDAGCAASQSITFDAVAPKVYTDADFALNASIDSSMPMEITSSDPSVIRIENGIAQIKGAGTAYITVKQSGDYTHLPAEPVRQQIEVSKAPLTVQPNAASRIYGDANPTLSLQYTGFKAGDTQTVIDLKPEPVTSATSASNVGQYPITLSASSDNNYDIVLEPAVLTVTPAPLQVKANDAQRQYRTANPSFTATYTGFKLGQNESVFASPIVIQTTAVEHSPVGQYALTVVPQAAPNYDITFSTGTLTIIKASLKILADAKTIQYGDALPALTYQFEGLTLAQGAEALTTQPIIETSAVTGTGVGEYDITLGGAASDNYDVTYQNATISITPKKLTVAAQAATKTYGDINPPLTFAVSGFVTGENTTVLTTAPIITTSATQFSNAGTYPLTVSGGAATNYSFEYVNSSLEIQKKNLTATAENKSRQYAEVNPAFTIQYSGFINGDGPQQLQAAPQVSTHATSSSNAGQYALTITGGSDENYTIIAGSPGILIIQKADQAITFAPLAGVRYQQRFALTAGASSGLPISYTSSANIELNQSQATGIHSGAASITASQPGNVNYNSALPVTIGFCVTPATPEVAAIESSVSIENVEQGVTYQWYRNGTPLAGEDGTTLSITKDGLYKVAAKAGDCSSDFSEDILYLVTAVEPREPVAKLYPNPAHNTLVVDSGTEPIQLTITSVNGITRYQATISSEHTIDIAHWARGVYIVKIESARRVNIHKLIVE